MRAIFTPSFPSLHHSKKTSLLHSFIPFTSSLPKARGYEITQKNIPPDTTQSEKSASFAKGKGDEVRIYTRVIVWKRYELSNHLGNVLSTITDRKVLRGGETKPGIGRPLFGDNLELALTGVFFEPDVATADDYYPFGMAMPGRTWKAREADGYRYGFNTQEKSPELGEGHYTAQFWEYDALIARRWELDPVVKVSMSPYSCFNGNPILNVDIDGDNGEISVDKNSKTITVNAHIVFHGKLTGNLEKANEIAKKIVSQMNGEWNAPNGKVCLGGEDNEYSVKFNVTYEIMKPDESGRVGCATDNLIELTDKGESSFVDLGLSTGKFVWSEERFNNKEYAHEFGHMIGWWDVDQRKDKDKGDHDVIGNFVKVGSKHVRLFGIMSAKGTPTSSDYRPKQVAILKKYGTDRFVGRFSEDDCNSMENIFGTRVVNPANRMVFDRDIKMLGLDFMIRNGCNINTMSVESRKHDAIYSPSSNNKSANDLDD